MKSSHVSGDRDHLKGFKSQIHGVQDIFPSVDISPKILRLKFTLDSEHVTDFKDSLSQLR